MPELIVPMVIEKSGSYERSFDIYSRLLRDRIIFLGTPIDDQVANLITAQMLVCEHEDSEAPIALYINSPGGVMDSLFAIYDVMQYVRCEVATICMGMAASAAAVLLAAGTPGRRYCLPNGRVVIHQPHGADRARTSRRHRHRGGGRPAPAAADERDPREAHRTGLRDDRPRHRPGQHLRGGRGEGLRADRRDLRAAQATFRVAGRPRHAALTESARDEERETRRRQ